MKIEEMKCIADARSKGRWNFIAKLHGYQITESEPYQVKGTWTSWDSGDSDDADARFSAMAATKIDKLLDLAQQVKDYVYSERITHINQIRDALKILEE
jgi:hypothetical protein